MNIDTQTTDKFIRGLRNNPDGVDMHIYYNLFSLLHISDSNFLERIYDEYKEDSEDFFRVFHKTFRQCDVFDDSKITSITYPTRTEEVKKDRRIVSDTRMKYRRNYDDNGKFESLKEPSEYESDEFYINLGKELGRLSRLIFKIEKDFDNPITGHLDSIFRETINRDLKGELYQYMAKFLKELNN
jgi:hypothetical protein